MRKIINDDLIVSDILTILNIKYTAKYLKNISNSFLQNKTLLKLSKILNIYRVKNILYSFILICFNSFNGFSQKEKILEPAILQVQYQFLIQKDTLDRNNFSKDIMILRIGKTQSQFFNYTFYTGDSLATSPGGQKIWGKLMLHAVRNHDLTSVPINHTICDYIYKNYPKGKITTVSQLGVNLYSYIEDYEPQKWQIINEHKQILDYDCQQAYCSFRGRKWTVWFAKDIPVSDGPWKFAGLPGLILEAYDNQKDYKYEAVSIRQHELEPITFYNLHEKKLIKTERIAYLKAQEKERRTGIINRQSLESVGISGSTANKTSTDKCYDPIEKDIR